MCFIYKHRPGRELQKVVSQEETSSLQLHCMCTEFCFCVNLSKEVITCGRYSGNHKAGNHNMFLSLQCNSQLYFPHNIPFLWIFLRILFQKEYVAPASTALQTKLCCKLGFDHLIIGQWYSIHAFTFSNLQPTYSNETNVSPAQCKSTCLFLDFLCLMSLFSQQF